MADGDENVFFIKNFVFYFLFHKIANGYEKQL